MSANNPYRHAAGLYEVNIRLPIIATIRRQEARAVGDLLARYAAPSGRALEIGPGTGFYTLPLARSFRDVVAVEDAPQMADLLRSRLAREGAANVTVHVGDFRSAPIEGPFDLVAAVGVLDYIPDPGAFVQRMAALAGRTLIVTVPQHGFLGNCFAAGGRLRGIRVFRHHPEALASWAPGWRCSVTEVGLSTRLTRGLTLLAVYERD